ncbi:MAG: ErpA-related iron-sulfur cluster insertion protein [Desulfovibrionaceae bacterium]|nr:ErpA-related iron-sulfur cluster insertion protein [Desulfovibrionaceae bacterium]
MFTVSVNDEMLAKIDKMLKEEDAGSCARLREYKVGCACSCQIRIGLSIDKFDENEDEKADVRGVPFIAEKEFLMKYGKSFELSMGESKQVVVSPVKSQA